MNDRCPRQKLCIEKVLGKLLTRICVQISVSSCQKVEKKLGKVCNVESNIDVIWYLFIPITREQDLPIGRHRLSERVQVRIGLRQNTVRATGKVHHACDDGSTMPEDMLRCGKLNFFIALPMQQHALDVSSFVGGQHHERASFF